jgi:replicative DNA helicase
MEKLLPQNIEAECGVLGSIIIDPEAIVQVADFLYPGDFYRDAHRTIYDTILSLYERRESADFITLCDALERRGCLSDVGGASYITSLVNQVPTSSNVEYYGRIVERNAILRELIHAAGQIAATAFEGSVDALPESEAILYRVARKRGVRESSSLKDIIPAFLDKLEFLHNRRGSIIGIPTGYHDLDRLLGGLQTTDLITLAARSSMGKSSLMLNIAYHAAKHNHPVAIFSLEMGKEQLLARLLALKKGIDLSELRNGTWDEYDGWEKIVDGLAELSEMPIYIDDTGGLSPLDLRSKARRLQAEHGIELVIVDYIGLMQVLRDGKHYENKVQEVSEITRSLKALALELNIPILALSQLNREVEKRQNKRPMLSDLRDSGSVEQDSDVVIFIYRDDVYKQPDEEGNIDFDNKAEIIVAKHRNGPVGEIELRWDGEYTRFSNIEEVA